MKVPTTKTSGTHGNPGVLYGRGVSGIVRRRTNTAATAASSMNPDGSHKMLPAGVATTSERCPMATGGFAPNGFAGISAAAAIIFFSYIGFDATSTAAEEAKDPGKDMPFGIIMSLVVCTVLYIILSLVMTGMAPWNKLGTPEPMITALALAALAECYADAIDAAALESGNPTVRDFLAGGSRTEALGSNNYNRANTELGDRLVQQSAQCTSFLAPDYTKITDINVRKAIAYAYPYEDMWLATGEVPGVTRVPANSIMPPGMAGKHDYFVDGEQFTYNPEKSKELLKEAGYEPGEFKITMVYYEPDPLAVAGQKVLVKGFEEAGFTVKGIPVQDSPYNIWLNPDDKINKTLNLRGVNWCSDWPSGLTMVPPLTKTGAAYNTAFFSEKSIDDEMNAITTKPLDDQADAWGAIDEKISTEYFPIIPTAFRNELFVYGSKIGNGTGDGEIAAPNYKDLFVMQ